MVQPVPLPEVVIDGRYRLDRELARGGMGRVYAATHVHLGTRVAIKVLDSEDASLIEPKERERFLAEARAAAQLRHPNVVQVTDYGIDRDQPYLVMELLEGETLRARLEREGSLDAAATITIISAIARALSAAHASGIVHRDLKPDNVFVGDTIKVLDFGIAKVATVTSTIVTASGAVLGTPAYMSPEQAQGTRDIDAASDRWALGVIAYECLVGKRPFDADALGELVLQICAWPMPTPSHHATVPAGFDAWFATACARDRDARFASAEQQAASLAQLSDARSDSPVAPERPMLAPAPRAKRRIVFGAALALAAAIAIVVAWRVTRSADVVAPSTAPSVAVAHVRIAVLPRDDSTPPELAPLADIVTDELVTRLAGRVGLRVIARASVMGLRGRPRGDLVALAKSLGADQLLLARVVRSNGQLQLALELVATDQTVTWSQSYNRPESELESVCALAASDLAAAVGAPRGPQRASRQPAAFRAYRTGREYWYRRDHDSLLQAIRYFEEALRIDPDYVSAWVGLVDAHLLQPWMGPTSRTEAYARAKTALDRALALEPESSEVQAARGNYLVEAEWDFGEAERAYRRAIELDPDNANAHQWLAEVLGFSRRFDAALDELRLAEQLDPLISAIHKIRSRTLYYAGRYAESAAAAQNTLDRDPNQPWISYGKGYALVRLGRFDEGLAAIKADPMMQVPGVASIVKAQELWVASRRGDRATVLRLRDELAKTTFATDSPFVAAFVAAIVEDRDQLYVSLARGIELHDPWMPLILLIPEFDAYRTEPSFTKITASFRL